MRYNNDDMTYAVVKYADDHLHTVLQWNAITEWVNDPDTWKKYPAVARLQGIRDYQFYRPIKVNGHSTYRECKRRFDEINDVRRAVEPLPDIISMTPNQFLQLPHSTQIEAILDIQGKYTKLRQDVGTAEMHARSEKVEAQWAEQQEERISMLEQTIQKTITKCKDQYAYIVQQVNDARVKQELEKYDIPMDEPNFVAIIDELESENRQLFSIQRELEAYRRRNIESNEGGENVSQEEITHTIDNKKMLADKLKQGLTIKK